MKKLKGIPASEGLAIGPVFIYQPKMPQIKRCKAGPVAELARLDTAIAAADERLQAFRTKIEAASGRKEAQIFEVHRLFLADPAFVGAIRQVIETEHLNAEAAVEQTVADLTAQFQALDDDYLRQRAADVVDVGQQLLRLLAGWGESSLANLVEPAIIIATDLTPSDTATLDRARVLAFCTAAGGATSHTTILARSLAIPAVTGLGEELSLVSASDRLLVDGYSGEVLVNPAPVTITDYQTRYETRLRSQALALAEAAEPAVTSDGHHITVLANIGSLSEAKQALEFGAEGVGLLRTEFLFLQRTILPDEEEQYEIYRAIADLFQQRPLIVRTLDVGGDKPLPALDLPAEQNPFLGRRAIRLSLAEPDLFQTQLRAILRAAYERNVKIMFPMIGAVAEIRQARAALEQAKTSLAAGGILYHNSPDIGLMVEIPSAALLADELAQRVDFFSIGTNDLTQYTLAADRNNPLVASLVQPLHPAVLRLIERVIKAGQLHHKEVGLCGELAGDLLAIPLLLGLGLAEFSMSAPAIPAAKALIRTLSLTEAQRIAKHCLTLTETEEVHHFLSTGF